MTAAAPAVRMTRRMLEALPEYSGSLPTGTTVGKQWRRKEVEPPALRQLHPFDGTPVYEPAPPPVWWRGTYVSPPPGAPALPDRVYIRWERIELVDE